MSHTYHILLTFNSTQMQLADLKCCPVIKHYTAHVVMLGKLIPNRNELYVQPRWYS